jgi:hypothetical protein
MLLGRCFHWLPALLVVALTALGERPLAGADKPAGKKYALLVGVKSYQHNRFPNLHYTENDVEELARVLQAPGAGFTQVVLLTSERGKRSIAAGPTAANIRAELKKLLARVTKQDTVLVALSGHGVQLKVRDPRDKKERDEGTGLGMRCNRHRPHPGFRREFWR